MAKYEKYAEYQDSGVEWIGEIPNHWATCSLSKLFSIKAGGDVDLRNFSDTQSDEYLYPIYTNANDAKSVYGYSKVANYQANSITVSGRGEVGFSVYRDHAFDAIIRLLVLTPQKKCEPKFFAYFINEVINFRVESSAIGQLSTLQISPYKIVLPSLSEQKTVVNFLDHETAQIDTLIAKQEKLIELLKEKRQAVISHAVTKGLNPDVAMKDSGVEWLGQVPEQWELYKLKHACSEIFLGLTSKVDYVEADGVPLVRALNIKNGVLDLSTARQISIEQHEKLTKYRCAKRNDILLSKSGTIGTAAIVDTDIEFSIYESIFALRGRAEILLPTYLLYFIQSKVAQAQYEKNSVGMGVVHLNMPDIQEVIIPLPPKNEQVQILEHLVKSLEYFKSLIYKAESAIQLMQERRTALISSAVTGKIDVRHHASRPSGNDKKQTEGI